MVILLTEWVLMATHSMWIVGFYCCVRCSSGAGPDGSVVGFLQQVKLWYDKVGHQLIVTVLGAKELPVRDDGRPRNPYVKIYFLPDRR